MATIEQIARAILDAGKARAGDEGGDVIMVVVGKILVNLLHEIQVQAQDLPDYPGSGWLELIRDCVDDRLAGE